MNVPRSRSVINRLQVLRGHMVLKTQRLHQRAAEILVSAKHALIDEKIQIIARGLKPGQMVTLQAHMEEAERQYGSCGHYIANSQGSVDTFKDPSFGGTYSGVEPMGLFWSIRTKPGAAKSRLIKADVMSPYQFTVALHDGFRSFEDLPWARIEEQSQASTLLMRSYTKPGVKRIPVEENGLHGTLFLPPGDGPFPGVIDLFGFTTEIIEPRSALLASHGIASFVITYLGHKDLPKSERDLDYNYFLRAFDFLATHPKVNPNALGGVATCGGGGFLKLVASKRPQLKCLVSINAGFHPIGPPQTIEGEFIEAAYLDYSKAAVIDNEFYLRGCLDREDIRYIPAWRHGAKILIIQGLDDQCLNPEYVHHVRAKAPEEYQSAFSVFSYRGAGHLLEPPFSPHSRSNFNPLLKKTLVWGGEPKDHAKAQEDSWTRILSFFHQYLRS